jgi:transcription elongation factor GreB
MNKAFTRETDEEPEEALSVPRSAQLPPGTRNYTTADGVQRMRDELDRLINIESPALAKDDANDAEIKRRIRSTEQRIEFLRECLRSAVPVESSKQVPETVRFGTTVTARDRSGSEFKYRIVGVDEIDLNRGYVSWLSPVAKALLNSKVGDNVTIRTPRGDEELQIITIQG